MEIQNEINNNLNIEKNKNNFLNNIIIKTINNGIDIGLKTILPDLIENQIIDIKNALLTNGLKSGIETAVNSAIDFGKSAAGIITGNFENISQIETAIGDGGIVDTLSDILDKTINKTYQLGYINKSTNSLIKNGKNILLENIEKNIENKLKEQNNSIEKIEKYINNWNNYFNKKDFEGMTKEYNKIKKEIEEIIPIENILKNTRKIDLLQNIIKNNGQNFEIPEQEKEIIEKLIK